MSAGPVPGPPRRSGATAWVAGGLAWAAAYAVFAMVDTPANLVVAVVELLVPPLLVGVVVQAATRRPGCPDLAARALAAAVAALPADRRDWGAALTAELAGITDRAARRRFALGAALAALRLSVVRGRTALAVAAAGLAAAVAAAAAHVAMPDLTLFAALFAALVTAAAATTRGVGWPAVLTGFAVVAAIVATVVFLRGEPVDVRVRPKASVHLAVALAGCLWLALRFRGSAAREAVSAAVVVCWFLMSLRAPQALVLPLLAAPAAAFAVPAFVAARAAGLRAGFDAAVRTVVMAAPLTYAAYLPEAARSYVIDGRMLDGDVLAPSSITLTDGLALCLGVLPALGLAVGVLGAGIGARVTSRRAAVL